ncbi:GTPase of the mitochondrial inner membrane that associates with the large ribosomal subunit [Dermatophagoides pteronyssinus]|uniref:GTPase of the mitochondrial inner membrane that associates with the large ribosomal subunit n=1 Tax=Dermatophagoides pteronyssinus TaxID=6956 RepID=A0ABQ8JNR9_DERPT|nr:GTPase of the mitochondrial inner membrane that associates with the large ribosomal subunit [Dermatophagoides pteronyssinus]
MSLISHVRKRIILNRFVSVIDLSLNVNNSTSTESFIHSNSSNLKLSKQIKSENYQQNVEKYSPAAPLRSLKKKSSNDNYATEFIDYKYVHVQGGKGGDGMICFLQLWSNPQAGPSGGDGGHGGHVIFEASKNTKSLNHIKSKYTGEQGENGMRKDMFGKNAQHLIISVPIGTLVKNAQTGQIVADLYCDQMKFLAAKGGSGGKGNHYFLSNKNRHPNVAEIGAQGENNKWILEMKIIAHAGLVGFPNAGKSTLLSALSRARPKVASYPFTTLKPSVGIVQYEDMEQLSIADLPGIIPEAHCNKGLGLDFLKHIERCVCLFFVIDMSVDNPFEQLRILMNELDLYKSELLQKPITIIANKMDMDDSHMKLKIFQKNLDTNNLSHLKVIPVSGKYGNNLTELLIHFRELYDSQNLNNQNNDE